MKKIKLALTALLMCLTVSAFAEEPKFTRYYYNNGILWGTRLYEQEAYLNGKYRSNFVNIPQSRMLNYYDGFEGKIGVFELEGNTLYVGMKRVKDASYLCLFDKDNHFYISDKTEKKQEESYFRYSGNKGTGAVTQIDLNGKKYVVAVAALNTSYDGYRMWVENAIPSDEATSSVGKVEYADGSGAGDLLCYEWTDLFEGVYKPGWKRLWATIVEEIYVPEKNWNMPVYKYNYKGTDFICKWDTTNDDANVIETVDGTKIEIKNSTEFSLWGVDTEGNQLPGWAYGIEGDVQIGKNKVRIAMLSGDSKKRIFVKDTTGYPVLKTEEKKAAPAKKADKGKKADKTDKSKKSGKTGKSAAFKRDYPHWKKLYSKQDILKGIYKSNYKDLPQIGNANFTYTVNKTGEEFKIIGGNFNLGEFEVSVFYHPASGWKIMPMAMENRTEAWRLYSYIYFDIEDYKYNGIEAEVIRNNETIYNVAVIPVDLEKGEYKLLVKDGPDEESALCEKDALGNEYYDYLDIDSGVYKPGFEFIGRWVTTNANHKALFENVTDDDPVFCFEYKGYQFLVGPAQDPADYVKTLDGTVIHNPETKIYYRTEDSKGNSQCYLATTYGWEGKVRLGDKDVILAVLKWGHAVYAFAKDL